MAENLPKLLENQKSYAGIPECKFVEDVDVFMAQTENNNNVESVLKVSFLNFTFI